MSRPNNNNQSNKDNKNPKNKRNNYRKQNKPKDGKPQDNKPKDQPNSQQEAEAAGVKDEPVNNPLYYFSSEEAEQMDRITRFSFPRIYGTNNQWSNQAYTLRGLTAVREMFSPSIGPSFVGDGESLAPINNAGFDTYAFLSSMNNKETKYSQNDVMLLILAMSAILQMQSYIRRALKTTFTYNTQNLGVPIGYLHAMGIDATDYENNLSKYRDEFNLLIQEINSIVFPANIPALINAQEFYDKVFKDAEDVYYTIHIPVPASTWQLNDIYDEAGGGLTTINVVPNSDVREMSEYLDILRNQLNAIRTSATWAVIYSDLLSIQDKRNFQRIILPLIDPMDDILVPEYNEWFNIMMRHATITGINYQITKFNVPEAGRRHNDVWTVPGQPLLASEATFAQVSDLMEKPHIVNFFETSDPTPAVRLEMSRWMADTNDMVKNHPIEQLEESCIAFDCNVGHNYLERVEVYFNQTRVAAFNSNFLDENSASDLKRISYYNKVANLPILVSGTLAADGSIQDNSAHVIPDLQAFSTIDTDWLEGLNKYAYLRFYSTRAAF